VTPPNCLWTSSSLRHNAYALQCARDDYGALMPCPGAPRHRHRRDHRARRVWKLATPSWGTGVETYASRAFRWRASPCESGGKNGDFAVIHALWPITPRYRCFPLGQN